MSSTVIESFADCTEDYFSRLLGKIKICEDWSAEGEDWRRLLVLASNAGLAFVAKDNVLIWSEPFRPQTPSKTAFQTAVTSNPVREIAVAAPNHRSVETDNRVTIISIAPSETYLVVCHDAPSVSVYNVEPMLSPPISLKATISVECRCVSVIWIDAYSFVLLTADGNANEADVQGTKKEWKTKKKLIAMDVHQSVAIWVERERPHVLVIDGITNINLKDVERNHTCSDLHCLLASEFVPYGEETLIVSSVKIVNEQTVVAAVVSVDDKGRRSNMAMGIITWDPETADVCIYPEMLGFSFPNELEAVDPCFNQCLDIKHIEKWDMWLVGYGEETTQPIRMITKSEGEMGFAYPEESFVWPLSEDGFDCLMFGMGIDCTIPIKLQSQNRNVERTCHAVIAASQNGVLTVSALGKEIEDIAPDPAIQHQLLPLQQSNVHSHSLVFITNMSLQPADSSQRQAEHVEADREKTTGLHFASASTGVRSDAEREMPDPLKSKEDEEEIAHLKLLREAEARRVHSQRDRSTLRRLINTYNDEVSKHVLQFNAVQRLVDLTKRMKVRVIDITMRGRHKIEELEQNEVEGDVLQQLNHMKQLRERALAVHQIVHLFQFDLRSEGLGPGMIEWDVEATIEQLKKHKTRMERTSGERSYELPSRGDIEKEADAALRELIEEPVEDLAFENVTAMAEWVDPQMLKTVTTVQPVVDEEDRMWARMTEDDNRGAFEMSNEITVPLESSGTFVLDPCSATHTQEPRRWIPERQTRESSVPSVETSDTASDRDKLELCDEEEIERIVRAQAAIAAMEEARERRQVQQLTPEQQKVDDLYSRLLYTEDVKPLVMIPFKLPPSPEPPSLQEFLTNLGRDEAPLIQQQTREEPEPQPSAPPARSQQRSSPEPAPNPTTPSTTASIQTSPSASPPSQGAGSFVAGGFSAFGVPSQMGSSMKIGSWGVGGSMPQTGASSSAVGSGFGAFARSQNVFGVMAQVQGNQTGNAFSAMARQTFGRVSPPHAFDTSKAQGNSKLFEMRK